MSRSSGHSKKKLSASLAKTGLLPVNSTAARVLGVGKQIAKEALVTELHALRLRIYASKVGAERERLEKSATEVRARLSRLGGSGIGPGGVARARRALDRAKWERESHRGRK
jgi:hypothetical protein